MTQTRTFPNLGEDGPASAICAKLKQLGAALDEHRELKVHNNGLVALNEDTPISERAQETSYERKAQRRSSARSRQGSPRRKGTPRGSRPAGAATRLSCDDLRDLYQDQVIRLFEAYPALQIFPYDEGMWLLAKSLILADLPREATFLVALPYASNLSIRAWGFWTGEGRSQWIGPRHTNLQDGSICAFSPKDRVWSTGDELVTLFDLYSVWALRHLYLEVFGRWPGRQYALLGVPLALQSYYRITQSKDNELCCCGSLEKRYSDCCKKHDIQLRITDLTKMAKDYNLDFSNRKPPVFIRHFLDGKGEILPNPELICPQQIA